MNIKRALMALGAAVAVFFVTLGIISAPAQAAAADCGTNRFCIWVGVNGNYTGTRFEYLASGFTSTNNYTKRLGSGVGNRGTSFVNNTSRTMYLFDAVNCAHLNGEWWRSMAPGQHADAAGSDWYQRVSAIGWNIRNDTAC